MPPKLDINPCWWLLIPRNLVLALRMQIALFILALDYQVGKSLQRLRIPYPSRHEAVARELFVYGGALVAHGDSGS